MKKTVLLFTVACTLLTGCKHLQSSSSAEGPLKPHLGEAKFDVQPLFPNERFGNVVVSMEGTIIATWGTSHVRARRSEDGGQTWGPDIVIAKPGFQPGGITVNETNGDIIAFVEDRHPPAPIHVYVSSDDGKTWNKIETNIKPDSKGNDPSMHMNEHGITLRHGPHKGRLLRPTRYYGSNGGEAEWSRQYTNAVYSDDGGRSWKTSKPFPEKGTGEATLVELSDGRIYYNSRVHWAERPRNKRRREAWSEDGGVTWKDWRIVDALPDGDQGRTYGCMGGLTRLPLKDRDILIFSNLDTDASHRERISVWASFDRGKTWPVKRLVDPDRSGYSSLAVGRGENASAGWIYLFYEHDPFKGAHLARFNLSWLLGGESTGDGIIPKLKLD